MRFREVERNIERETINNKVEEETLKVKVESNISAKEAMNFWNDMFKN